MKKKTGFSLIEILVILTLMAMVMIMMVSISNASMLNSRFASVINNFIADFNSARTMAATENCSVAIVFDGIGRRYTFQVQDNVLNNNWRILKTVYPLDGYTRGGNVYDKCFKPGEVTSFVINSMGEVRTWPLVVGSLPTQAIQQFFIIENKGGKTGEAYRNRVTIYPYGGYKIEKIKV